MLKNCNIICISSIDWDFLWQQHQEIMSTFAQHGNTVLFIENTGVRAPRLSDVPRILHRLRNWRRGLWGFRKEQERLYIYSPLLLPFPYSRIAQWVNRRIVVTPLQWWMRSANFHNPIIWTFLPTQITLDIAEAVDHRLLVYYATDNFSATSKGAGKVVRVEPEVIGRSDVVFANSRHRFEYCKQFNPLAIQIPMGVSAEVFEEAKRSRLERPDDLKDITTPIIGYVGGVRRSIDQQLIRRVAADLKDCTLVFVGPLQTDIGGLRGYPNIRFIGDRTHREIPRYIQAFDCCIIPYVKDEYTDSVSAAKLHEYLIMGKPVVSTNIAEVEWYAGTIPEHIVYVARTPEEFVGHLRTAIRDNGRYAEQRIEAARERVWSRIIQLMSSHIEDQLALQETSPMGWQERFVAMFRRVQRRMLKVCAVLAAGCVLVFYSPLMWWVAAPLKMSGRLTSSDAIVVFAGGVGESGEAGEGYQERVKQAVELYHQGYAPTLVFSSGYTYVFREADVMKALAVDRQVPTSAIILETKARNTVENVRFTHEILQQHGWRRILLVSSPYHMRRALLAWRKAAPDVAVIPAAVPESQFYAHHVGVSPRQIHGILHEYLGIVFYWMNGWV